MSNDFVSRQWLLNEYDNRHKGPPGGARKMIEEAPAADVRSVVYCQECIYLGFKDFNGICNGPMCGIVKPWDYCSHGLRGVVKRGTD